MRLRKNNMNTNYKPTPDNSPLYSVKHKKTSDEWDFKIPYIGKLNRVLDWLWLRFHRPKLSGSNNEIKKK